MPTIVPEPGLVIPYVYLWRREHENGEDGGRKTRPALIVIAVVVADTGVRRVAVCPVTSQQPDATRGAVEMPRRVKAHLGLDVARSWIVCDEYNEFDWPGVDLDRTSTGAAAFGHVPDALLDRVRSEMLAARARSALQRVPRTT